MAMRERTLKMVQEIDEDELERTFGDALKVIIIGILVFPTLYFMFTLDYVTTLGAYGAAAVVAGIVWLGTRDKYVGKHSNESNNWFFNMFP